MKNPNFSLFLGCLGNGVTVCNRAVTERGDYKRIAHIDECGKISWYADRQRIPPEALEVIESVADGERRKWEAHLSQIGELGAYAYFLDRVPWAAWRHETEMRATGAPLAERIEYLKAAYLAAV